MGLVLIFCGLSFFATLPPLRVVQKYTRSRVREFMKIGDKVASGGDIPIATKKNHTTNFFIYFKFCNERVFVLIHVTDENNCL